MLVQLQHSYLLINRNALWETGAEAVPIWDGVLSQQCTCCHSHMAFYLVVVPKLHSESSDLRNTDWKIVVIIPTQTGQEHVGLIQGGSIPYMCSAVLGEGSVWATNFQHSSRQKIVFFSVIFLQHITLHLT